MPGDSEWLQPLPIRRITASTDVELPPGAWPMTLAPVAQLVRDGLRPGRVTVLVGENGSGKSTIVEAIAMAYGLNAEGGSIHARHQTWTSESVLHTALRVERGPGASKWGYFVRAETMHGLFTFLDSTNTVSPDPAFHRLSHGESFLALIDTQRFRGQGLYVMDEPEAGLSFSAQLALVGSLASLAQQSGTQVIIATHSPILAALPGATVLELDEDGFHETTWDDLAVVDHHRRFLDAPERYLRHVVD
ncbi:MAG: AAA family ATPase [Lapillicoccus sp.]